MKICQINCIYGKGSTGKIMRDLHLSLLSVGVESLIIVPLRNEFTDEKGCFTVAHRWQSILSAIFRRVSGFQYDWAFFQTRKILQIIKKEAPDIVHLQCINGNDINVYRLLSFLAKNDIRTLITIHAEFPYTGGCGHAYDCDKWLKGCGHCPIREEATQSLFFDFTARTWKKWKKAYSLFKDNRFQYAAVSPWLLERARQSPMLVRFQGSVVFNGVDTTIFHYDSSGEDYWRNKLKIAKDVQLIVFVTASFFPQIDDLKGGRFIIEFAKAMISKNVKILIAANHGEENNLPKNVIYLGEVRNQIELARLYSAACLSLVVSRRETYSMPVVESLCCGTPVVGFKAGGPESIALQYYSCFVEYGNLPDLVSVAKSVLERKFDKTIISRDAQSRYSKNRMLCDYMRIYNELM